MLSLSILSDFTTNPFKETSKYIQESRYFSIAHLLVAKIVITVSYQVEDLKVPYIHARVAAISKINFKMCSLFFFFF